MAVIVVDGEGYKTYTLGQLLPLQFDGGYLAKDKD